MQLAQLVGTSDTTIGNVESRRVPLTFAFATRLAEALNVDAVGLYGHHALDQMKSAVDAAQTIQYGLTNLSLGIARIKVALDLNRKLEALDLPSALIREKDELVSRIADELKRLEQAMRGVEPAKRGLSQRFKTDQRVLTTRKAN